MKVNLNVGDKISRPKANGLIKHVGVYLGNERVFHNLPGRGEHVSSLAEFVAGQQMTVIPSPADLNVVQLNWRVQERLNNPKPYHTTDYNCEHAASYVLTGQTDSPQLQGWAILCAATVAFALLAR